MLSSVVLVSVACCMSTCFYWTSRNTEFNSKTNSSPSTLPFTCQSL